MKMNEILRKNNRRAICAFCANLLIVVLEFVALILSCMEHGVENFHFYTQGSNYLTMAASLLYCIYAIREISRGEELPRWLHSFRYISICCLLVTFFVVLIILMPMSGENALYMLYGGSMLYQHTLCPILAVFSFFAFEGKRMLPKTEVVKAMIPTFLYAFIMILLNTFQVLEGPYFFLMVYRQPWYISAMWCLVILCIAGFLAFVTLKLYNFTCWQRDNQGQPLQKRGKI